MNDGDTLDLSVVLHLTEHMISTNGKGEQTLHQKFTFSDEKSGAVGYITKNTALLPAETQAIDAVTDDALQRIPIPEPPDPIVITPKPVQ